MMHLVFRRHAPALAWRILGAVVAALVLGLALLASTAHAQESTTRAIVLMRGADTVLFQRIEDRTGAVHSEVGGPGLPRMTLTHVLGPAQGVQELRFTLYGPNAAVGAAPLQSGQVVFEGDSAILSIRLGERERRIAVAAPPGTMPLTNNDFVVAERMVARARAIGGDTVRIPVFLLANAQVASATVIRGSADSMHVVLGPSVTVVTTDDAQRITGGRVPVANLEIRAARGVEAARLRVVPPDYSAPADAPYRAEAVEVQTPAGHKLTGTLTIPRDATAPVPAVVTITGSGQQDRDEFIPVAGGYRLFREVADTLGRRGIATLRLDDRGIGGSGGDVNGTTADFADDIRAAITYLRGRADIDGARIALVGHSEGGTIAPMIAAEDDALAGIVLLAGTAYTGRQIIDYQMANAIDALDLSAAAADSALTRARQEFEAGAAQTPWMRFFLTYDPLPTARRVRVPALILNGARDQQVRPEEAELLAEAMRTAGNADVTLHILPDQNHLFLDDPDGHPSRYDRLTDPRVNRHTLGLVADWLARRLDLQPRSR